MIASNVRAARIMEEVAHKHRLSVETTLCAVRNRWAIAARAEIVQRLTDELRWTCRQIGAHLGWSPMMVCKLRSVQKNEADRAKLALPNADLQALAALTADDARAQLAEAEAYQRFLESELERLTGRHLALRISDALEMPLRFAIVLGILAEHYPRWVSTERLCDLYGEARTALNYGDTSEETSGNLMSKHVCDLGAHFRNKGWAPPVDLVKKAGYSERRLGAETAQMLSRLVGAPKRSQLELVQCPSLSSAPASISPSEALSL